MVVGCMLWDKVATEGLVEKYRSQTGGAQHELLPKRILTSVSTGNGRQR